MNSTYERTSDLANIAQLASQASACTDSAKKPTLRERLETTQKAAAEAHPAGVQHPRLPLRAGQPERRRQRGEGAGEHGRGGGLAGAAAE